MLLRSKILCAALLASLFSLSACNYITGGADNSVPPTALADIKPELKFTKLWSVNTGKGTAGTYLKLKPLYLTSTIVTIDAYGALQARDLKTGKLMWSKNLEKNINQGVAGDESIILVSTSNGELLALSSNNGEILWQKSLVKNILNNPSVDKNSIYIQTTDGSLYSLNKSNGQQNWQYRLPNPDLTLYTTSTPLVIENSVIAGFASGKLIVFDKRDGTPKWAAQLAKPAGSTIIKRMVDIAADPLVIDGTLYAVTYQGKLKALDLDTGKQRWEYEMSAINNLSASAKHLYVSDAEGTVWALNRQNGRVLWKQDKLFMRSLSGPRYVKNSIVVGDYQGYVHGLSQQDGGIIARTKLGNSEIRVAPEQKNGIIYILDTSGKLAAYNLGVA